MKNVTLPCILAITLALSGCAASLVYDSDRSRKQQDCYKIQDPAERQRCLQSAGMHYDDYRKAVKQQQVT